MSNKHVYIIGSLLFAISALMLSCNDEQIVPSGNTVKIGLIGPFSGPQKAWGDAGLMGSQVALKMEPYLLNGDKVEIIIADDQNDPAKIIDAVEKLAETDNVSAIMILSDSEAVLAAIEYADAYQTPILALMATHPDVTDSNYVSQLVFDDTVQGTIAAHYAIDELFVDQVAVFNYPENTHSRFLADEFSRSFEEAGGRVVNISIAKEKNNFPAILKRLQEQGFDFLYLPLSADQVIQIKIATGDILWSPQVMVSDGLLSEILLQYEEYLNLIDGVLAIDVYSTLGAITEYGVQAARAFKKSFDVPATTFAAVVCEGTSILQSAMDRCGDSTDRKCINRMLRNTVNFSGIVGKISINEKGKAERPAFVNVIKDGEMKFVVKVY